MARAVCLEKLKRFLGQADQSLCSAIVHFNDDDNAEVNEARSALSQALDELGVAPPGYDADFLKEHDIDPNGVVCECPECRPAVNGG